MAGVRNQARLAAQLRLRRQVARQDELVSVYFRAEAAVERAERKLATVRAQCERRLAEAEAARDHAAQAQMAAVGEIAREIGEERAAEVLEVSLNRVRSARRSIGRTPRSGPADGRAGAGAPSRRAAGRVRSRDDNAGAGEEGGSGKPDVDGQTGGVR